MGISAYKIMKWYKMLTGKSISHVNQGVGTCYSKTEVAGYYNDLTEKVTKDDPNILVPKYYVDTGKEIYFSIGIFQYGLASYDLFYKTQNEDYKRKLISCAEWAVKNQQEDGAWITFDYENPSMPYSSMAQGEGISLLIRALIVTNDERYSKAAKKALSFMLLPVEQGGTTKYNDEDVYFYECPTEPLILNGWIFSLWGVYDYVKYYHDREANVVLNQTLATLKKSLHAFDIGYWSKFETMTESTTVRDGIANRLSSGSQKQK